MLSKAALYTLILSNALILLIGFVAYRKNASSATNRLFGLLCVSLVGWSVASYITNVGNTFTPADIVYTRIAFIFTALQNLFFLLLINTYPGVKFKMNRLWAAIIIVFSLGVASIPLMGSFFFKYTPMMPMPGPGMTVIMVSLAVFAIVGVTTLVRKLHRLSGTAKNQSRFLIVAAAILWILIPLAVGVLPIVFQLNFVTDAAPLVSLLFALTIAYAVVKQRLFDIRPFVARSLSYGLFLFALVVAYVVLAFGVSSLLGKK